MAEADARQELKKRARRRLVGALALAVTAAVVLPMVMDQQPRQPGEDIQIRIPSQDGGALVTRVVPGRVAPASPAQGAGEPVVASTRAALPPSPAATRPEPAPGAGAQTGSSDAKAEPSPAATAESKPAAKPEPKPAAAAEPKAAERAGAEEKPARGSANGAEPARTPAMPEAQTPAAGAPEQYIVQLGVFASADNARKIQARVKAHGYSVYTEPVAGAGAPKTRVRAGPFASRAAAEQARERLDRAGLPGIVAPGG